MRTFRFRFPAWYLALMIGAVGVLVWAAYRIAARPTIHWLDALLAVLTLGTPFIGLWREARQLGASLRVSASGIEYTHPEHPSQNWHIPAAEIERVATLETAFERKVLIVRTSGTPRQLAPAYWEAPWAAASSRREHPLVATLAQHFPTGPMDRAEAARALAPAMELGRVAARLTVAAVVMAVLTIAVAFSIPLDMLGDGIPWPPILAVFAVSAGAAMWLVMRDPTTQLRIPAAPFLFGVTAAFLFTISAQKAVYLIGTPEQLGFRLVEVREGFQIWRDLEALSSPLEFPAAKGKYRAIGTVVEIEIRHGPFGLRAVSHAEIRARLSK